MNTREGATILLKTEKEESKAKSIASHMYRARVLANYRIFTHLLNYNKVV